MGQALNKSITWKRKIAEKLIFADARLQNERLFPANASHIRRALSSSRKRSMLVSTIEALNDKAEFLMPRLQGWRGTQVFSLAQFLAYHVENGNLLSSYRHQPHERWPEVLRTSRGISFANKSFLSVDCAGFIRRIIATLFGREALASITSAFSSDRDVLRAKDFYNMFSASSDARDAASEPSGPRWHRVRDLRNVKPGDILCYRKRGSALGGSSFVHRSAHNSTKRFRYYLEQIAIKVLLASRQCPANQNVDERAFAQDEKSLARSYSEAFAAKGVRTCKTFMNAKFKDKELGVASSKEVLFMLKEACETSKRNTGHIVVAASYPILRGDWSLHVKTFESTKRAGDRSGILRWTRVFSESNAGEGEWVHAATGWNAVAGRVL